MLNEVVKDVKNGVNVKKERDLSLDLVRIFSMSMICVAHYLFYSNVISQSSGAERAILSVIYAVASSVVNTFVVLSGFLLFNKKFKLESLLKLWLEMIFAGVVSVPIAMVLGIEIGVKQLAWTFAPLLTGHFWFISVYIVLYMMHSAIDKFLDGLNYKQFTFCVLVQMFLICILYSVNPFIDSIKFVGFPCGSILVFIPLYSIGCYLKKFSENIFQTKVFYVFSVVCLVGLSIVTYMQYVFPIKMDLVSNDSLFGVVIGIFAFLCIRAVKIRKCASLISFTAQSAIAVYLFQESELIRFKFWGFFDATKYLGSYNMYIYMVLSMIVIWVAAILIHQGFVFIYNKFLQKLVKKLYFVEKLWVD